MIRIIDYLRISSVYASKLIHYHNLRLDFQSCAVPQTSRYLS